MTRANVRRLQLDFESVKSIPYGFSDVHVWHDTLLNCDRVGKRFDLLGLDASIAPEAETLQAIDHANVVHVVAAARVSGYPPPMDVVEIVTPYFPAGSVSDALLGGQVFTAHEVISLVRCILRGLEELHEVHGLIHRDVKSGNVLLASRRHALVADLGLVGRMAGDGTVVSLDNPTIYSPPEQQVVGRVGRSSDLYGVALIALELLTGPFPYAAITRESVISALIRGQTVIRPDRIELPPWVPESLRRIIRKATRRRPEERFANSRAFDDSVARVVVADWSPAGPNVWTAPVSRGTIKVEAVARRGGLDVSLSRDLGRGFRRVQPAVRASSLGAPESRRLFDQANSIR